MEQSVEKISFEKISLLLTIICFGAAFGAAQELSAERLESVPAKIPANHFSAVLNKVSIDADPAESGQNDRPLKILHKPRAAYPTGGGCFQGKVVLRVTFLQTGKIGPISVISGLGNGATEKALEAAKKIKFKPSIKNGKPVPVTKAFEYTFTIY